MASVVSPNFPVRKVVSSNQLGIVAMAALLLSAPQAVFAESSTKKSTVISVAAATCSSLPSAESVESDVLDDDWQSELGAPAAKSQDVVLDCAIPTPDSLPHGSAAAVYASAIELMGHDGSVSGSNGIQFSLYSDEGLLGSASSSSNLALPYSVGAGWHKSFVSSAFAHGKPLYRQPSTSLFVRVKLKTAAASFTFVRVYFTAIY